MDTIVLISAIIVALTVVIVLIAAFRMFRLAGLTIQEGQRAIEQMRQEMVLLSAETRDAVGIAGGVARHAEQKLKELDGVFAAVKIVGDTAHSVSLSMQQSAAAQAPESREREEVSKLSRVSRIAQTAAAVIRIWKA
ncbi:DUF948 domain-containing protein [Paenibacillus sp. J5C_2022]|uniref:DUF948 domain-containing protein n=1 Tax=Paenibacillus sp. J5C2022 TaxID=2977129 RepID=UPI0021D0C2DC|nr:DUF948 domain-containing protein [Paenibacillus sp. J5C2022]MCU6710811.1 DUF948 domain-containing protein [Paenibacillus sp. J5C2022]